MSIKRVAVAAAALGLSLLGYAAAFKPATQGQAASAGQLVSLYAVQTAMPASDPCDGGSTLAKRHDISMCVAAPSRENRGYRLSGNDGPPYSVCFMKCINSGHPADFCKTVCGNSQLSG